MSNVQTLIVAANTVTLVCGGLVTLFAYRASIRTRSPALRALAVGLGMVTLGGLLAGALHQFTSFGIEISIAIQSGFTALGFLVLAYSLYVGDPTTARSVDVRAE